MAGGVKSTKAALRRMASATRIVERQTSSGAITWRRPRHPRRGGGGDGIFFGELIADVPAKSKVADAVEIEPTWNQLTGSFGGAIETWGVVNMSWQALRGSVLEPVAVFGIKRMVSIVVDEGPPEVRELHPYLVIINTLDYGITPGFSTGTPDELPQAPYHRHGEREFTMDGGPCAECT